MTFAIHDFKAIREATLAFPKDRPQNVVKAVEPISEAAVLAPTRWIGRDEFVAIFGNRCEGDEL